MAAYLGYLVSHESPCQPNPVELGGCLARLVEVRAAWSKHSRIYQKTKNSAYFFRGGKSKKKPIERNQHASFSKLSMLNQSSIDAIMITGIKSKYSPNQAFESSQISQHDGNMKVPV